MFEGVTINWDMVLFFMGVLIVGFIIAYLLNSLKKPVIDSANMFTKEVIDKEIIYRRWKKDFNIVIKISLIFWLIIFIFFMYLGGYDIERKQNNLGSDIRKEEINEIKEESKEEIKESNKESLSIKSEKNRKEAQEDQKKSFESFKNFTNDVLNKN